jgi:methionyl-tRNA synthetase
MTEKYNSGILDRYAYESLPNEESDTMLLERYSKTVNEYVKYMEKQLPDTALDKLMELVSFANKYIDLNEPWNLAKDEDKKVRLNKVLYMLAETIRSIAVMLKPYMTKTPSKIFEQLGVNESELEMVNLDSIKEFGKIKDKTVCKKGENIFPRIDEKEILGNLDSNDESKIKETLKKEKVEVMEENKEELNELITIDEFAKVKLKVAQILEVERVENSDKLYKLLVDLGNEKRTVVSGIVPYYTAEELLNKKIVLVSNLKPAKLRGIESQGMLLAAGDSDIVKLLVIDADMPNGTNIH